MIYKMKAREFIQICTHYKAALQQKYNIARTSSYKIFRHMNH